MLTWANLCLPLIDARHAGHSYMYPDMAKLFTNEIRIEIKSFKRMVSIHRLGAERPAPRPDYQPLWGRPAMSLSGKKEILAMTTMKLSTSRALLLGTLSTAIVTGSM